MKVLAVHRRDSREGGERKTVPPGRQSSPMTGCLSKSNFDQLRGC